MELYPSHQNTSNEMNKFPRVSDISGRLSAMTPDPEHTVKPSGEPTNTAQGQLQHHFVDPTATPPKTPPKRPLELESPEVDENMALQLNPPVQTARPAKRRRRTGDDLTIAMKEDIYQPKDGRRPVQVPRIRKDATPPVTARRTITPEAPKEIRAKSSSPVQVSDTTITSPSEAPAPPTKSAPPSKRRRSTESKEASKTPSPKISATPAPIQEAPPTLPSATTQATVAKPLAKRRPTGEPQAQEVVDDGFMPSQENDFQLRHGSSDGCLSAKELENLLKPPRLAEQGLFSCYMSALSFKRLGQLPAPGLADALVKRMERVEKDYQRGVQGAKVEPEEWWNEPSVEGSEERRTRKRPHKNAGL